MGRTKTDAKQKSSTPIRLPHDGPIAYHSIVDRILTTQDDVADVNQEDRSLVLAIRVLQLSCDIDAIVLGADNKHEDEDDDVTEGGWRIPDVSGTGMVTSITKHIIDLCTRLRPSKDGDTATLPGLTTKEQLNALQIFRGKVLQWTKDWKLGTPSETVPPSAILEEWAMMGLYRLLLEWSLSYQTPVPFQRAIQSNLNAIREYLDTVDSPTGNQTDVIHTIDRNVLQSLWERPECWKDPFHSFDVAVNYQPLRDVLQHQLLVEGLKFLCHNTIIIRILSNTTDGGDQSCNNKHNTVRMLQPGEADSALKVATILKMLLTGDPTKLLRQQKVDEMETILVAINDEMEEDWKISTLFNLLTTVQEYVSVLLCCPNMPTDGFNTLGILYGRLFLLRCTGMVVETLGITSIQTISTIDADYSDASPLARLCMVQGIAAALDMDVLTEQVLLPMSSTDSLLASISPLEQCWRYNLNVNMTSTDPLVRWATIKGLSTLASRWRQHTKSNKESGPINMEDTIPSCSQNLNESNLDDKYQNLIQETLQVVFDSWENPPLRKLGMAIPGLFRTLVELLPQQELQSLCRLVLNQPINRKGRYLALDILLPHMPRMILDSSSTIVPVESLLEGIGDRGPNAGAIADLWIKILKLLWNELEEEDSKKTVPDKEACFASWTSYWVPYLSSALVVPSLNRRRQVASFCLPRIVELMKEVYFLKTKVSSMFVVLMREVDHTTDNRRTSTTDALYEGRSDRNLWAQLELCRYSMLLKVSKGEIQLAVADVIGLNRFKAALTHISPPIRIVAFQTMELVISAINGSNTFEAEASIWMYALPYSMTMNESSDYLSSLLQSLTTFLDRLSQWEAGQDEHTSLLQSFTIDFLISDLVVTRGAYPGTVPSKEIFSVTLLDSLLVFVLRDEAFIGDSTVSRNGPSFCRYRSPEEVKAMNDILLALLSKEVFSSLLGLMHSTWENTRVSAFQYLCKSVIASQSRKLSLPEGFSGGEDLIRRFITRGIYLASSPRQRESDTGARILAFLYSTLPTHVEREALLFKLVEVTRDRVTSMRNALQSILSGNSQSGLSIDGSQLPLAHGLVHASRLCVDHEARVGKLLGADCIAINGGLFEAMTEIYCKALQLSLSIVADVREGGIVDGVDEDSLLTFTTESSQDSTPLNVNTGAIGANGNFSSVARRSAEESKSRIAVQRVVIGTWLLTKEACAAIATVVTAQGYRPDKELVSRVGRLLLSTLTTLKHAGAAFAARDSLQKIATNCLNQNMETYYSIFPSEWLSRLLDEISLNERVRNSTLRRSTGYALGFLAIMRAEVATQSGSIEMSKAALSKLLKLSLPPKSQLEDAFALLKLDKRDSTKDNMFVYAKSTAESQECYVEDTQYESRCRVHALNVLRLVIMDAPLTSVISPFIGDAIISSILGYNDDLWAIRNSSTMVFAAAMLRVVDADKNASNSDKTSNNAITLSEMFRRYPPLEIFIPAVLEKCLDEMELHGGINSQMFPILLMLSRVQGVSNSRDVGPAIVDTFVPLLVRSLGSRDHSIRDAAARCIANLSSLSMYTTILSQCKRLIDQEPDNQKYHWNAIDGHLLAISKLDLASFKDANSEARSLCLQIQSSLFDIVTKKTRTVFPPMSRATALKVLLSSSSSSDVLVGACEQIIQGENHESVISGSLLSMAASEGLCLALQADLWMATNVHVLEETLTRLRRLLTSDLIDVRLVAVKCFKKHLYENVAQLHDGHMEADALPEHDGPLPPSILLQIARMLLECTATELRRDQTELGTGAHVPTVRRLSRCYIEVASSLRIISSRSSLSGDSALLWSVSQLMTKREAAIIEDGEEANGGTVLSSNAVEMMALAITSGSGHTNRVAWLEILLHTISRLNTPHQSWRSRYSAALSLETCHDLWKGGTAVVFPESIRKDILLQIVAMLQDSDSDVRTVAVRAATKFCNRRQDSNSLLPDWTLERTFPLAFGVTTDNPGGVTTHNPSEASKCAIVLFGLIIDNCSDLVMNVRNVIEEYNQSSPGNDTDGTYDPQALVNTNQARDIFEVEVPNPHQETMLVNQLTTRSLWTALAVASSSTSASSSVRSGRDWMSMIALARRVLIVYIDVVRILLSVGDDGTDGGGDGGSGIVHEVTRAPSVFPSLHGMLSAAYVCLSTLDDGDFVDALGGGGDAVGEARALAGRLLRSDAVSRQQHPAIQHALRALHESSRGHEETTLRELTFLLKNDSTKEIEDSLQLGTQPRG